MAITVGFISEKGGVGKTTACYHVAVGLKRYHRMSVLVIDADYQRGGISGRYFPDVIEAFGSGRLTEPSLYHRYQALYSGSSEVPDVEIRSSSLGVDVVPADPRLSTISVNKLPETNNIVENNKQLLNHLATVRRYVDEVGDEYDYILIDSHPKISDVLRSVICASDYCVSPVKLDRQSSIGVASIVGEIANVNADVTLVESILKTEPKKKHRETKFSGAIGMMARDYGGGLKDSERSEYNLLRRAAGGIFKNYVTEGDGLRRAAALRA